ncbi:hypothetical protein AP057_12730 [Geobacillus sp. Sah69]|uniref:XkdQ/YqbQ family protein n=1 Tax=Geobacillus sp. Sah69 TaxID=1737624 RepID=UPI0006DC3BBE|nr:hypothetical protein [Geobacillus sp. Sah69]KQC48534.1 hypothetical protein AP057_12730 [Geobacillus sp. Sah69]
MYPGQAEIKVVYNDMDITHFVMSVEWSGDVMQACRTLKVSLMNTLDGRKRLFTIEKGKEIRFYNNSTELFRGVIFAYEISSDGNYSITAYDENVYLTKSIDTRKFTNMKASDIVRRLCSDFGIPVGPIADTGYVIPKLILRDKTLYDMIITALTETKKHTGRRFILLNKNGKLVLQERKAQVTQFIIENGVNIISAKYSQSIEDLKTQVKVIGGDPDKKPIVKTVKNDVLIKKYGIMQHLENADSKLTKSQIEQLARQLLKEHGTINDEATVDAIGIDEVIAGTSVYVKEPLTGIVGGYYVITDSHHYENRTHTMSITLSATDELPTLEYEEVNE